MIVYKVDLPVQLDANAKIEDMAPVLAEIAPSLRILLELLEQHETSFSTPSVGEYRDNLKAMIPEAIRLTQLIYTHSQKLAHVSGQASKQLVAFEDQIKSALLAKESTTKTPGNNTVTTGTNAPSRPVSRMTQPFRRG